MDVKSILTQVAYDVGMELEDLCFMVATADYDFPFSFFAFEDENCLGLFVTDENGAEKIHVIMKSEIIFFRVHYLDELKQLYDFDEHNKNNEVVDCE